MSNTWRWRNFLRKAFNFLFWCGLYLLNGNAHVFFRGAYAPDGLLRDRRQAGFLELPDLRIFSSREKYKPVWTGSRLSDAPPSCSPSVLATGAGRAAL